LSSCFIDIAWPMRTFFISLVAASILAASATTSPAGLCVSCTGPNVTYDCTVKNADSIESLAGDKALRKICTKVLKKTEKHASCRVINVPAGKCTGVARTVGWGDVKKAATGGSDAAKATAKPPAATGQDAAKSPAVGPPAETVGEPRATAPPAATADAAGPHRPSSPDPATPAEEPGLGDKIKGAAQNTWKCVSSFFGNC
jgi:hypothetical protein